MDQLLFEASAVMIANLFCTIVWRRVKLLYTKKVCTLRVYWAKTKSSLFTKILNYTTSSYIIFYAKMIQLDILLKTRINTFWSEIIHSKMLEYSHHTYRLHLSCISLTRIHTLWSKSIDTTWCRKWQTKNQQHSQRSWIIEINFSWIIFYTKLSWNPNCLLLH